MINIIENSLYSQMDTRTRNKKMETVQKITLPKDKYQELDGDEIKMLDGYGFIIKKEGEDYE
jgi:hypothetical protein